MFGHRINCPCSKCGSKNTELRKTRPGKSFLGKIVAEIAELSATFERRPPLCGTQYIVCKDCGHIGLLIS